MVNFVKVNLDDKRQEACGFSPYIKVFCLKEKQKESIHAINEQIHLTEQALISDADRKLLLENLKAQKEKLEHSLQLSETFADDHKVGSKARDDLVKALIESTDTTITQINKNRNIAVENKQIFALVDKIKQTVQDIKLQITVTKSAKISLKDRKIFLEKLNNQKTELENSLDSATKVTSENIQETSFSTKSDFITHLETIFTTTNSMIEVMKQTRTEAIEAKKIHQTIINAKIDADMENIIFEATQRTNEDSSYHETEINTAQQEAIGLTGQEGMIHMDQYHN